MRVGVPKEIKNNEFRVGLTPASVAELSAATEAGVRPTRNSLFLISLGTPTRISPLL